MLREIKVKNFAIIEDIEVQFNQNMTVLTGQTGAGKSLIIDAIGLVLGARADLDMIRSLIQGKDRMPINFHIYLRPGSAFGNEYSTDCIVSKMLKLGFLASMFTLPEDIASSSSSAIRQAKSQAEVNS